MNCIHNFFNPEYQKKLKHSTFSFDIFEKRLLQYKKIFTEGIKNLQYSPDCNYKKYLPYNIDNESNKKYIVEYLNTMQECITNVSLFFDDLINLYKLILKNNSFSINQNFTELMEKHKLLDGFRDNSILNERPFFRGRVNDGSFDISNPINCFHIPFNLKNIIKSQRFSASGVPMLYYGNSVMSVCKELEHNIDDLVIYSFLPTYKVFKNLVLLSSTIYDKFTKNILITDIPISKDAVTLDIKQTILYEILTFPRNQNNKTTTIIDEYILPQAFTKWIISKNKWNGIVYISSKDYTEFNEVHPFSRYNYNLVLFTNNENNIYDGDLFYQTYHDYSVVYLNKDEPIVTVEEAKICFDKVKEQQRKNNTNCISYLIEYNLELFDYFQNATINGVKFYDTEYGKAELKMFKNICCKIQQAIEYQAKHKTNTVPITQNLHLIDKHCT